MSISVNREKEILEVEGSLDTYSLKSDSAEIIDFLRESRESVSLRGGHQTALAYLLSQGLRSLKKSFFLVAPTDREAEKFYNAVSFFLGKQTGKPNSPSNSRIRYFPSRTGHKIQSLGKMENTARRIETLYALRTGSGAVVVVTSAPALIERLMPPDVLVNNAEYLVKGEQIDPEGLCRRLTERGYYPVSLVEEYGDFSRRGGVIDIYSPLYRWPVRLEFFGDELESIRFFHPSNQRSMGVLEDVVLLPSSEIVFDSPALKRAQDAVYEDVQKELLTPSAGNVWLEKFQQGRQLGDFEPIFSVFYEKPAIFLDYPDAQTVLVWSDMPQIRREMEERYWDVCRDIKETSSPHEWKRPPAELFLSPEELITQAERYRQVWVNPLDERDESSKCFDLGAHGLEDLALTVSTYKSRERLLEPLAQQFRKWTMDGVSPFLVCRHKEQAKRLVELLQGYGIDSLPSDLAFGEESHRSPVLKLITGELEKGFFWPKEKIAVICEEEIFGRKSRPRSKKSATGLFLNSFQDLHLGDLVVHIDHGIGVYKELMHLSIRNIESDFLLLEYQDGDKLYVPVDKLQKVQKYLGLEGHDPRVDKLGGKSWDAAKKKAAESAERIAEELLNLYAARQVSKGFEYSPPDKYFNEFEATFGYDETPDQEAAIEDVLNDMASTRPMDRLICGDVGYGKTEVALRAAFRAVMDGKQVAMLVPTTVLAEQHLQTLQERFAGFPIEVASLSRFKTSAQQKQVLEGLTKGKIDVVVGTHRLIQKDVAFRELGLLIIDEEHRFGVKDKERLKQMRVSVDVLTLTATPIPRTLHMSLAGIRDLSTIETPPQDRHSIETYVYKFDEQIIEGAIRQELHRSGQVFFVHNHVQSIYQMATLLARLAPEARIAVAHGQMKERDLEKIMLDFIHRKIDVLVCTTIIESGLDIPAANTIIINRADKFGLAQIYQLRGRVGRATEQAYAYLLIPGEHLISPDAQKRLRALMDFSELGAGFKIALNDLQIRGGGTILGSAQSGHIAAIGYELYLELLEKTMRAIKGEEAAPETVDPEINVPLSAFLPESFIPDTDQRLLAYKRLAVLSDEEAVDNLSAEWRDRYGPFPVNAGNLILLAKVRLLFKRLGVIRMDGDEETFTLHFARTTEFRQFFNFLQEKKLVFISGADQKLKIEIWGRHLAQRMARLKRILQELCERVSD
ncbi:MAG: transcription-repair coupling factor [Syntrophobacteraceae bacterium]